MKNGVRVVYRNLFIRQGDHSLGFRMQTGFGWIEINGERYEHDIVIHTDHTITKRQKKLSKPFKSSYGHTPLSGEELAFLAKEKPEVVYIGTGQYGDLPLTPETQVMLAGFNPRIKPTPEILRDLATETRKFTAILHVTC
jgi:hypothetical protein